MSRVTKQSLIDDEEHMLKYLLSLKRDEKNIVMLGTKRYSEIPGWDCKKFIQTLYLLQNRRNIELDFRGHSDGTAPCFVLLKESALAYFEDQNILEEEEKDNKRHDYLLLFVELIGSGLIGFLLGRITG